MIAFLRKTYIVFSMLNIETLSHSELVNISIDQEKELSYWMEQSGELEKQKTRLKEEKVELEALVKSLTQQSEILSEMVLFLRRQKFAPKSEKGVPEQASFFDEAEVSTPEEQGKEEESQPTQAKVRRKARPKRSKLPESLPRRQEVVELDEEARKCEHCGVEMSEIGEVRSEKLDIEPLVIKVVDRIRKKYACKTCECGVKTAPVPKDPIPKSMSTPGLLSFIAVNKYQDRLPLYAMEGILQRNGVRVARNTLASWMVKSGELIQPLINLLQDELLATEYIRMDETPVQVLKEPGKKATSQSYMWLRYKTEGHPVVLFEYDPTRGAKVATGLLEGFRGYLQVDGYAGYDEVCRLDGVTRVTRVGCMAHVRRKCQRGSQKHPIKRPRPIMSSK